MVSMKPTIKGIFVNSHIKSVQKKKGAAGLKKLEQLYGKPVRFKNSENVPVREEVKVIEAALQVLVDKPVPPEQIALEAGRLHFKNFVTTPLARILFPIFRKKFKFMMLQAKNIAGHVFQGVEFSAEDSGPKKVKVIMKNNDYPLEHFQGLFAEWMAFSGLKGSVEAQAITPTHYEYPMQWQ